MPNQILPAKFQNQTSAINCPRCGKPMKMRNGRYGQFYGCTGYPTCTTTLDITVVKQMLEDAKVEVKPQREFKPSVYQQAVFQFVSDGNGHAVVEAVAGSGKTTTIVKALELTPKGDSVLFCAFNKHIADHLASELRRLGLAHVKVGTLHSIGYGILREHLPNKPEVDEQKLWNIIQEVLPMDNDYPLRPPMAKLASLAKATLVDALDPAAVEEMAARYGIELNGDTERLVQLLPKVLAVCLERSHVIDYDDMIWMPVVMEFPVGKYDWVFVDECNDLNASQIDLILQLINSKGRIIAVGDRRQSIYGFRGADVLAIPKLVEALQATVLPLSITYRCPKTHVALAKEIVPQIEAAENAIDGIVRDATYYKMMEEAADGDLILCRINAPLVKACYSFIRRGQKAIIRGRDVGAQLQNMIDRLRPTDIYDLLDKIRQYKWDQSEKLRRAGKENQIEPLYDRCDTLEALCDGIRDLSELKHRIASVFDDVTKTGIVLSSVHRAKGDEAMRVYILKPELMPHPMATQGWQLEQESNIKYVAHTRSKNELIFVSGE